MVTEEDLYKEYVKEICSQCNNKDNDKDLCNIHITYSAREAKCNNYEKCMKTKCNRCNNENKCFKGGK